MSRVNRNQPKRSTASDSRYSLTEFDKDFPDDAACLDYLVRDLYPNGIFCPTCNRITKHHREHKRPSYSCQFCGHREHPMVGTIFQDSATSLRLWFYAIYLMSSTRCGISAKQLERELGVTYKTAWRMFNRIRSLLGEDPGKMSGTVEVDETYIGGKRRYGDKREASRQWAREKQVVAGHVQRGGKIRALHLPEGSAGALVPLVHEYILPASSVYTDELPAYKTLAKAGYRHRRVHHAAKVFVKGDVHTNTIDGFWALLKNGIHGIYRGVSTRHLQSYLNEFTFRYNNRQNPRGMFNAMTSRIEKRSSAQIS